MRAQLLLWSALAMAAGWGVYAVSTRHKTVADRLARTERQIVETGQAIEVLNAEWAYLNRPDRLESLAKQHLPELRPTLGRQFSRPDELPRKTPAALSPEGAAPERPVILAVQKARR